MKKARYPKNYIPPRPPPRPLPPSLEPLLKGRVASAWLVRNGNKISKEDLKAKYTGEVLSKPTRISLTQFKVAVEGMVMMGIKLKDTVDEELRAMDCEMIDEAGRLQPKTMKERDKNE